MKKYIWTKAGKLVPLMHNLLRSQSTNLILGGRGAGVLGRNTFPLSCPFVVLKLVTLLRRPFGSQRLSWRTPDDLSKSGVCSDRISYPWLHPPCPNIAGCISPSNARVTPIMCWSENKTPISCRSAGPNCILWLGQRTWGMREIQSPNHIQPQN